MSETNQSCRALSGITERMISKRAAAAGEGSPEGSFSPTRTAIKRAWYVEWRLWRRPSFLLRSHERAGHVDGGPEDIRSVVAPALVGVDLDMPRPWPRGVAQVSLQQVPSAMRRNPLSVCL